LQARLDAWNGARQSWRSWLPRRPAVRLHPNLAGLYRYQVADLREALAEPLGPLSAAGVTTTRSTRPPNRRLTLPAVAI
jgi:hypothetical protein